MARCCALSHNEWLDALFGRPLQDLLNEITLPVGIRAVLLDPTPRNTKLSTLWRLVLAYEAARWHEVSELLLCETGG